MAIATYTQQLEEVQAAIKAVESTGQSYSMTGRSLNRGDLKTLYDRERQLRGLAAREAAGGKIGVQYGVPTP